MKKPYIIAETAYGFEGEKEYLVKQVENISNTNIDCIKFHIIFEKETYAVKSYQLLNEYLEKWILSKSEWKELLEQSKKGKLDNLILVDDVESIKFCKENKELVDGIEVHAACVNDIYILDEAIKFAKNFNKVFYLGISGFEFQELSEIIEYLKEKKLEKVILMYGFQNFPTKIEEINLSKIKMIKEAFEYEVGYADHTKFDDVNKENLIFTSYSLGATLQEVHYVLEEGAERIDYVTGLNSKRLIEIKDKLLKIHTSIGNIDFRLNEGEKKYLSFRKIPVYTRDITKGEILRKEDINYKRVEISKYQHKFKEVDSYFGKKINKSVKFEDEFEVGNYDD